MGLIDSADGDEDGNAKNAAFSALHMAKDMIYKARKVMIPRRRLKKRNALLFDKLEFKIL